MSPGVLEKDSPILHCLHRELVNVVSEIAEERVGDGHLVEPELADEHLLAVEVQVLGDGLLVLPHH